MPDVDADPLPLDRVRTTAVAAIRALDDRWREPRAAIAYGDVRWRPDLIRRGHVLHLAVTGEVPHVWLKRLSRARDDGRAVTVALGAAPEETETLSRLQDVDARIVTVELGSAPPMARGYRSVADWIAAERIQLSPADLQRLAGRRFEQALAEPTNEKGRIYEEVLCLVFSQVSWLTVDAHAYRNASEEIDLVLGVRAVGYLAGLARGPVALATAKNEAKSTGSDTVKYLKEQMANRKGRCRLGFLCSAGTISEDARREILRGSQGSEILIAELDRGDLESLLADTERLDDGIEVLLRRAMVD